MRFFVLLLLSSCSALVEDEALSPGACVGSAEQCEQTDRVRIWYVAHVEGYEDRGLRTEWSSGIAGATFSPRSVLVTSARALCHELMHAHLWRKHGDGCPSHSKACGWDDDVEARCKAEAAT